MPANANDQCCVYYISDASCTDPYRHGYVGITSNETSRRFAHRRSGHFPADFVWTILFRGTRQECAAVEKQYRPERAIGWNNDRGGGRWRKPQRAGENTNDASACGA
jgi:hypothetical protein